MPFAATTANRRNFAPWASFALYGLCSGALAAWGRSYIGIDQALTSRYTSISLWISVALIGLVVVYFQKRPIVRGPPDFTFPLTLIGILALMLVLAARHQESAELKWNQSAENLHYQRLALTTESFSKGQAWIFNAPPQERDRVPKLVSLFESQGYMHPNHALEPALKSVLTQKGPVGDGMFLSVERRYPDSVRACGWTTIPFHDSSAQHNRVAGFLHGSDGTFRLVTEGPLLNRRHDIEREKQLGPTYAFDMVGPLHPYPYRSSPWYRLPKGWYYFLTIVYRDDLTEFAPIAPARRFFVP